MRHTSSISTRCCTDCYVVFSIIYPSFAEFYLSAGICKLNVHVYICSNSISTYINLLLLKKWHVHALTTDDSLEAILWIIVIVITRYPFLWVFDITRVCPWTNHHTDRPQHSQKHGIRKPIFSAWLCFLTKKCFRKILYIYAWCCTNIRKYRTLSLHILLQNLPVTRKKLADSVIN